ncbi:tetratricopeptide repeat protein [Pleionea sp. CnH1-48]|uniref:tetratricopeptide repeat protein n=1 Tax=Pleionea sp. CnH1-48 TaxID=2954494 RepID=UPI0020983933|nr:tetratricopeptide repeat protein [Pleionea sp. CnH1-48]MCO7226826.1 tetratricopeptide repeat protein [Pleionea sp. CnH1-48]
MFKEILERRVLQIVGGYLAFVWLCVEMSSWLSGEFNLSTRFPLQFAVFFLTLLPAVTYVAYNHGAKGRDEWSKKELWLIIVNLIISGGILAYISNKADKTLEVVVEKSSSRQPPLIAIIPLKNLSDEDNAWWSQAFTLLLQMDLEQNKNIRVASSISSSYFAYNSSGSALPIEHKNLKSSIYIANKIAAQYLLTGEQASTGDNHQLKLSLYSTNPVKKIKDMQCDDSLVNCVDQFTQDITQALNQKWEGDDYPALELVTSNVSALKDYTQGLISIRKRQLDKALELLESAVSKDSQFALALAELGVATVQKTGNSEESLQYVNRALKYHFKLPNDLVYVLKTAKFNYAHQYDKQQQLLESWNSMESNNIYAKIELLMFYMTFSKVNKTIKLLEEVSLTHKQYKSLLARQYMLMGDLKKAQTLYTSLYAEAPEQHHYLAQIARTYHFSGEYEKAHSLLDEAALLLGNSAEVDQLRSRFFIREGRYNDALPLLTSLDSFSGSKDEGLALASNYRMLNQPETAIEIYKRLKSKKSQMMVHQLQIDSELALTYAEQSHFEKAREITLALSERYDHEAQSYIEQIQLHIETLANNKSQAHRLIKKIKDKYKLLDSRLLYADISECIFDSREGVIKASSCESAFKRVRETGNQYSTSSLFKLFNLYYAKYLLEHSKQSEANEFLETSLRFWPAQQELQELKEAKAL